MATIRRYRNDTQSSAQAAGLWVGRAEGTVLRFATVPVWRFSKRHPVVYAILAFLLGGFIVGGFTMSTYTNWVYEGINLKVAFWQVVAGSIGGGLAMVATAFAYAGAVGPTRVAMREDGVFKE